MYIRQSVKLGMGVMCPGRKDRLKSEFIETLPSESDAVSIDYLLNKTSAKNRREAKEVLRTMIDEGIISTTPGFKYKLASNVPATK